MPLLDTRRSWIFLWIFQVILFFIFSKIRPIIDLFSHLFEWQKDVHTSLFSIFPFSIGDIFYLLIGVFLLVFGIQIFYSKRRKKAIKWIFITLNIFYFLYQMSWGMLYFQPPISERLPQKTLDSDRLKKLSIKYLELSKQERSQVKEDENGVFKISDIEKIKYEVIHLQSQLPKNLIIKKKVEVQSIKPSALVGYFGISGILGYYNPFTAEAQYNPHLPDTYLPFTIAHETAHQMGYAREQEANFFAYLIGKSSYNSDLKYSVYYYTLKSLLQSLYSEDRVFVEQILEKYSDGMKRDREFERKYWKENKNRLDDLLYITNDLFLKSNQQEGSITYSYFIDLLNMYEED